MTQTEAITYSSYLKVPELLELQQRKSRPEEHDEMLFIVIHQVYELWFKQMLHEGDRLKELLCHEGDEDAFATVSRMLTILKTMVAQIDVLETMTPISFLSFRDFLQSASGFQSAQFREFEFLLGYKRPGPIENYPEDSPERRALRKRYEEPSIWHALCVWFRSRGFEVPDCVVHCDHTLPTTECPELHPELIRLYKEHPHERALCEKLVDLDEGIQEWRYRHVMMVQRTIGMRPGTGGSPGVDYLRRTLFNPLFPDLWAIRGSL
ncbi:MAG: tryptophan 2,3-dioxygenase family protein [Planctomycetota bacterium]|nr:tryptophan 2,3-dioxygenase family protein [Planctomycetota bacterium]MEC9157502.1 tryptophan 2,3-dioxygenase family protein [Planctomycetota bacterium]MEC9233739.1 tryptophan 2,3-dioxygenase family protein [Planctomycetota bacterium]